MTGWIVTFIISERDGGRSAGYISSGFFGGLTVGRIALMWINRKVSMRIPTVTWDDTDASCYMAHTDWDSQGHLLVQCAGHRVSHPAHHLAARIHGGISTGRLEITVWFVPSLIENAVAVAVIGLFLGPMYPLVMTHTSKVIPKWLVTGSIGWIAGFGQVGNSLLWESNLLNLIFVVLIGWLGAPAIHHRSRGVKVFHQRTTTFVRAESARACHSISLRDISNPCRLVGMTGTMVVLWALVPKSQRRLE